MSHPERASHHNKHHLRPAVAPGCPHAQAAGCVLAWEERSDMILNDQELYIVNEHPGWLLQFNAVQVRKVLLFLPL